MLKQKIMSIFEKIKSFEFDKNRNNIFGIKSGIVWAFKNYKFYCSNPVHFKTQRR